MGLGFGICEEADAAMEEEGSLGLDWRFCMPYYFTVIIYDDVINGFMLVLAKKLIKSQKAVIRTVMAGFIDVTCIFSLPKVLMECIKGFLGTSNERSISYIYLQYNNYYYIIIFSFHFYEGQKKKKITKPNKKITFGTKE